VTGSPPRACQQSAGFAVPSTAAGKVATLCYKSRCPGCATSARAVRIATKECPMRDHQDDQAPLFELDEKRRLFLQRAFASSFVLAGGSLLAPLVHAIGGQVPRELPAGRSIYDVRGDVRVDG